MPKPTQAELDAAYAEYQANFVPPKEVGVLGGLDVARKRAPATIASQFKSMGAGVVNATDQFLNTIPGGDFGQGPAASQAAQEMSNNLTRSALMDRAYQDYLNPLPQAGLGKYSAMLGESLAQGVPALGAGLLTGGLGAAGTMAGQYYGESRLSQLEENPNAPVNEGRAAISGLGQAAIDMTLGRFLGGGLNPIDNFAAGIGKSGIAGSATRGVIAGGARGAIEEGIAETLQQGIDRWQVGLDVNPFTSQGARDEYGQAFTTGALLGGGMGSVTGGLGKVYDDIKRNQENQVAEVRRMQVQDALAQDRAYESFFPIQPANPEMLSLPAPTSTEALALPAPEAASTMALPAPTGTEPTLGAQPDTYTVAPDGTATPREDLYTRQDEQKAAEVVTQEREAERAALILQAGETQSFQSETRSPFTATTMLTVRGKPTYRARILGLSEKEGYVRALNQDTNKIIDVPRQRLVSKAEPKDPDIVAKLPATVRRAEELRAKDLHQRQVDAMLKGPQGTVAAPPVSAPEGSPPLPSDVAPTAQEEQPPITQGEPELPVTNTAPAAENTPAISAEQEPVNETPESLTDQAAPVNETPELAQEPVAEMPQSEVPTDPRSNSWIVQDLETGKPVLETFSPDVAAKVNTKKYKVWPAYQWLTSLNAASPKGLKDTPQNVKKMRKDIGKDVKMPYEERQRLAQVGETQTVTIPELAQQANPSKVKFAVAEKEAPRIGQGRVGVAQTSTTGPELATPVAPMSTTAADAVYVLQKVDAATQDPNFIRSLERALKEELRTLGFNGRIPIELQFNPDASHWATARSNNGQSIVIALGLANNYKDIPGAVQALRPFLTGNVVAFGETHGLLTPQERDTLLKYAKAHKDVDGKTLYENVAGRFEGASPEVLEREAIAYATEYLTRLNPEKWRQEKAAIKRQMADPRARPPRKAKTAQEKSAFDFKAKLKAVGEAIKKAFSDVDPDAAYDIAMRLAKGDVAYRAMGDQRFAQPVKFAGWVTPPAQAKALGEQIRKYMDDMGLSDVGLRMSTSILDFNGKAWTAAAKEVKGAYFARTVTLSMAAYDPNVSIETNLETMKRLVDHEVVHALRATGAWAPNQWLNLVTYVNKARDPATNETYIEKAQRLYGAYTKDMSPAVARDVINEEAVAMAFAHNFDSDNPVPTGPRNLLSRIAQVLFGVGRASYLSGVLSPEMLTPNGNEIFAAIRSGQAAKDRRENAGGTPADTAVKFAIADTAAQNVNPGIDPDVGDIITQSNKRNRNPFDEYLRSTDLLDTLMGQEERAVPFTQRIPGLAKIYAPIARLEGHDKFLILKGRTVGAISNMKQEIAIAIDEAQKLVGNDARKREQITAYMEGGWQAKPTIIEDARLRDLAVALKLRVSQHGRLAVEQGLLAQEAFERLDGKYLHRMYTTDKNRIFNSIRLLMPDMGWTKSRSQISEIEKINRGEVTDPLVGIANYLAKSGEALAIDRMMDTMGLYAAEQATDRPWIMDASDMIVWRGKKWSPLAVEAEIESLRTDVLQAAAEWANPDPIRAKKTEVVEDTLKNARLLLMRNPLWLKLRGLTPAEVAAQLGVEPTADLSTVPKEAVAAAYDTFLRIAPDVRNNRGDVGAQFKEVSDGIIANFLGDDYMQVPNTAKWGRLRGMMVIREIYDVMNATGSVFQNAVEDRSSVQAEQDVGPVKKALSFMGSPEAAAWVMSFYKKAHTVFNPSTHGVNWVGNMVTFETLGGAYPGQSAFYGYKAIRQIMDAQGEAYEIFRELGGGQTGQHASELTALADPRFQAALKESMGGLQSGDASLSAKDLFNKVREAWSKIDNNVSNFYQLSDSIFKVAKIQMDLDRGLPPEEAFLNAQDLYLDYTIVPPVIRAIRAIPMGAPFITWTYLMSGQIIDKIASKATLKVRPDGSRLEVPYLAMMAPTFLAYMLANSVAGADDFEEEDKKYLKVGLPSFTDGGQGLMFAGLDSQGRPKYFDFGKYWAGMTLIRLASKFDDIQDSDTRPAGLGSMVRELGFMSDPYSQAMLITLGRDPGNFKPLTKTGTSFGEGAGAQVAALTDLMLPPWLGGMADGKNSLLGDYGLANSLASKDSPTLPYEQGRPALTFGQKAAKLFGVTTYLTDPMPAMAKKVEEATRMRSSVQSEVSRVYRDEALSEEARAAKVEKLRARYERMLQREEDVKTEQAEMTAFYDRYRAAVVAKGLPDPYADDIAEVNSGNKSTKGPEIKRYMESIQN